MLNNVPLLWVTILAPLGVALLIAFVRDKKTTAILASLSLFVSATCLLVAYVEHGANNPWLDPLSFNIGGLGMFGLMLDAPSFLVAFSIALTTALIALYSLPYMEHRFEEMAHEGLNPPGWRSYYFLYVLFSLAMIGTVLSTNIIEFYVFLELTLIPSFLLIAFYGYGDRIRIAIMYLLWTHVGALLFLIGALTVGFQKGFDFIDPSGAYKVGVGEGVAIAAYAFWLMIIGLSVKLAVLGVHMWLPYAHAEAPTPISALLSPNLIGLGGAMMFKIVYVMFPKTFASNGPVLTIWALATIIYGGLMALNQTDFKRLLAYSSISQMGYLLLGLSTTTPYGVAGTFMHYMVHAFGKAVLFGVAGTIIVTYNGLRDITKMGGLAEKMPYTASLALLGFMHITGIPPTAGLWSEYLIVRGTVERALQLGSSWYIGTALALLVGIGLSTAYAFLTMRRVFYGALKVNGAHEAKSQLLVPLLALAAVGILAFLLASPLIDPLVRQLSQVMSP